MESGYGNRKTNIEGRNRDRQLWPACHFLTPPCTEISPGNNPGGWKKPRVTRRNNISVLRMRRFHKHLNKSLTGRPHTLAAGGDAAALQHWAFLHMQMWSWCERHAKLQPERERERETGWTLTCTTSTQPNLNTHPLCPAFILLSALLLLRIWFTVWGEVGRVNFPKHPRQTSTHLLFDSVCDTVFKKWSKSPAFNILTQVEM